MSRCKHRSHEWACLNTASCFASRKAAFLKEAFSFSAPYAITRDGRTPNYWNLTQDGYRLLHGESASLPKRRCFEAIRPGHHHHTFCLAETIVHLCITAQQNDCEILHFARENSVKLEAVPFIVNSDCAFVIRRNSEGKTFPFVVELDNGTERVRSKQVSESIERKLRAYDIHQSRFDAHDPERYLVLFITTRSELRLRHILDAAAAIMTQPQRRVFVGVELNRFLAADTFNVSVLEDHRRLRRQMIPSVLIHNHGQKCTCSQSIPRISHMFV